MNIDANFVLTLSLYFLIALGLVVVGFTVVGSIAFWKTQQGAAKSFTLLLQRGNVLKITTVSLIIVIAALLALAGKIGDSAVVGILSLIAGFVLGSLDKNQKQEDSSS
jgi:hypothetical protein